MVPTLDWIKGLWAPAGLFAFDFCKGMAKLIIEERLMIDFGDSCKRRNRKQGLFSVCRLDTVSWKTIRAVPGLIFLRFQPFAISF